MVMQAKGAAVDDIVPLGEGESFAGHHNGNIFVSCKGRCTLECGQYQRIDELKVVGAVKIYLFTRITRDNKHI